ncbi:apolipoprotein A-IV-like [Gadus chalcogrammus]|uniref:apolipoprotein A-IV-like n=1 Tax=Gadus chalcogrammus TaxID=1042646 RepID=UPI0024C4C97A|nr:apolipoprotein A-IV-like [Gadus chalcogrammus]
MKLFVVVVLAVFAAGCNAEFTMEPQQQLDMAKDLFWDYVAKMTRTAEDSVEQIKQSQLGHEFNKLISESTDVVNKLTVTLQSQAAPMSQELLAKVSREAEQLKGRVESDLSLLSAHLQPYADELKEDLERQMSEVTEMTKGVTLYARAMDADVQQKSRVLKERLDQSILRIQEQMGPLTDELRQKMDQSVLEFQRNMEPITQDFQRRLAQRTEEIQRSLTPYGEDLKKTMEVNSQKLQEQLDLLWETVSEMTK